MNIPDPNHTANILRTGLAAASALLLLLPGAADAQFTIPSWTIDGGGGTSTGGAFSLTGTIGQPEAQVAASTGGGFTLAGGFWGRAEDSTTGGYATWAAANIPQGQDASFGGDADGNGIPNGIEYAFNRQPIQSASPGVLTAPSAVPSDVVLNLTFSSDLLGWQPRAQWISGAATPLFAQVTLANGLVTDTGRGPNGLGYWRYEAILQIPAP